MRESGWYRIKIDESHGWELAEFSVNDGWLTQLCTCWDDSELFFVDERMVMTPEGELVYHGAEHDPAYNTQQEG